MPQKEIETDVLPDGKKIPEVDEEEWDWEDDDEDIEEGLADIKAGRTYTTAQVKKKLGL